MANLVHPTPQFGFHPSPVNHSPSPFGFGFGLSTSSALSAWQPHPPAQSHHVSSPQYTPQSQHRILQKRRHDDDDDLRDESMDRSPTPERRPIKRLNMRRTRTTVESGSQESSSEDLKQAKQNKCSESEATDDVDVGVLLASLPPQSLLPILTSLLTAHPSLKPAILSLIPRPTLQTAIQALNQAAKKLRDAYPYSTSSSGSTSFGFGNIQQGASRANMAASATQHGFRSSTGSSAGMRDSYVLSRLRPHIVEFVSTSLSYMPYFSLIVSPSDAQSGQVSKEKVPVHPTETFSYLSALTGHLLSQPPLAQSSLAPLLLPRLIQEWLAWVDRVDKYVNKEAGMFGMGEAQGWVQTLDEFGRAKIHGTTTETENGLKAVRDRWIASVGWLVGRRESQAMDDDEEL